MYWLGLIFFVYSLFLAIVFNGKKLDKNVLIGAYSILGLWFSYYITYNISILSKDYLNYSSWFNDIYYNQSFNNIVLGKDPIFQLVVSVIQKIFFSQEFAVYFFIVFLIFFMKIKFCSLFFNSLGTILLMWLLFSQTFVLFEITQIRAGLAIALASFAISRGIIDKKNDWLTSVLLFISVFTHFSTILLVLVYLTTLFKEVVVNRFVIFSILLFSAVIGFFLDTVVPNLIEAQFSENIRFIDYLNDKNVENLSLFSVFLILKLVMVFFLLFFWNHLKYYHKAAVFLSAFGCALQIILSFNTVFGLRFSELFIFFSLVTFIVPMEFDKININLRYIYFFCLLVLGFIFYISSMKILLG